MKSKKATCASAATLSRIERGLSDMVARDIPLFCNAVRMTKGERAALGRLLTGEEPGDEVEVRTIRVRSSKAIRLVIDVSR